MKILITGGLGFLGSHLCRYLLDFDSVKIFLVDNLSNRSMILSKKVLYSDLAKDVRLFTMDIQSTSFIETCLSINPDRIYHLGAMNTHEQIRNYPVKTLVSSVTATANVIKVARYTGSRILFTSSCDVYGLYCGDKPIKEDDALCDHIGENWRISYAEAKRACEAMLLQAAKNKIIDVRIVRIFDTFGPGLQRGIVYNSVLSFLSNQNVKLMKDGTQVRSFCCGYDIVQGLVKVMEETSYQGPINMGHPNSFKMIDFIKLIRTLCSSSSKIELVDSTDKIPHCKIPDLTLIKSLIGWNPDPVSDKLIRTIKWIRSKVKRGDIIL